MNRTIARFSNTIRPLTSSRQPQQIEKPKDNTFGPYDVNLSEQSLNKIQHIMSQAIDDTYSAFYHCRHKNSTFVEKIIQEGTNNRNITILLFLILCTMIYCATRLNDISNNTQDLQTMFRYMEQFNDELNYIHQNTNKLNDINDFFQEVNKRQKKSNK